MAKQNVYDDAPFFEAYVQMRALRDGLHESVILPALGELLPDLNGARVVDLGCGRRMVVPARASARRRDRRRHRPVSEDARRRP